MRSHLLALAMIIAASTANAATYTVYPDYSGEFQSIQAALDAASDGDVIQLANGIFWGDANRNLDTNELDISIVSLSDDPTLCVIDCQGSPSFPSFALSFTDQGPATLLRGIAIINGYSVDHGGALRLEVASPTIENCIFADNYAYNFGGAIYAPEQCSPVIRNCIFRNNTADYYGHGGAIYALESSFPIIEDCTFQENSASLGSALYCNQATAPMISGSTFHDNTGSAIFVGDECTLTMDTSLLAFNNSGAVEGDGSGMAQLSCCDVYGNTGGDWTDILAGQGSLNDNLQVDPQFYNPASGELQLEATSPCAAANNPSCGQIGAWPVISARILTVAPRCLLTIQEAIEVANSGLDTVELLDGTYGQGGNRDINFLGKAITVRSASGDPTACILNTQGYSGEPHRGFVFEQGEGHDSRLQGIRIYNGWYSEGGAIYIDDSSPTIENCHFDSNDGYHGGAVYVRIGSPIITDCEFQGNEFYTSSGRGGGLAVLFGSVTMTGCRFIANGSGHDDPSMTHYGAALYLANLRADATIADCTFVGNSTHRGGVACFESTSEGFIPIFSNCTFVDNSALNGSVMYQEGNGPTPAIFSRSIIAFNNESDWLSLSSSVPITFECCNVFGNATGDWIGPVADMSDVAGNMSVNPKFCDPASGDYALESTSPCLDAAGCGLIGSLVEGCDYRGLITAVTDVPNDQGRRVRVSWNASSQDAQDAPYVTTAYSVWRLIDDPARKAIAPPADKAARGARFPAGDWDYLTTVSARGESQYNLLCETLADSTVSGGMHLSTFFVSAETELPLVFFDSEPASGYSVDNLAPSAPGNLRLETPDLLAWDEVAAPDFDYFTAYGSQTEVLDGTAVQLGTTVSLSLDLPSTDYPYYLLTATDFSGNEGVAASLASGVNGVGDGPVRPTRFALYPAWPNPATSAVNFSFDLPRASKVTLAVYDLAGRRVATLVDAEMPVGTHIVPWNGRVSGAGGSLASGVYSYRLQAGQYRDSGRVVILK